MDSNYQEDRKIVNNNNSKAVSDITTLSVTAGIVTAINVTMFITVGRIFCTSKDKAQSISSGFSVGIASGLLNGVAAWIDGFVHGSPYYPMNLNSSTVTLNLFEAASYAVLVGASCATTKSDLNTASLVKLMILSEIIGATAAAVGVDLRAVKDYILGGPDSLVKDVDNILLGEVHSVEY